MNYVIPKIVYVHLYIFIAYYGFFLEALLNAKSMENVDWDNMKTMKNCSVTRIY